MELQSRVVKGFGWTAVEKLCSGAFLIAVALIVVNRIVPDDTMMVAILTAVVAILNTFVDSGFAQTLIRKLDADTKDFSSVFFFNISIAVGIYLLLLVATPPLARLYDIPMLTRLAPVLFLIIPVNALCIIQQTILTKEFNFKRISSVNFTSNLVGGAVAVSLAVAGTGAWALVGQRLAIVVSKAAMLWLSTKWRPRVNEFSKQSIGSMYRFSSKLFVTDFINNAYANIPTLFMGRLFQADLGYYNQAQKFKDMPVSATWNAVNSVTLPTLSNLSDKNYTSGLRKVTRMLCFALCPIMVGLIATAPDIFHLLIKEDWWPSIPLFQVLCIGGVMSPVALLFNNSMKARSNGNVIVAVEVLKKVAITLILIITIPISPMAIACGQVAVAAIDFGVNFSANRKYSGYKWKMLLGDLTPILLVNAVMFGAVVGVGYILPTLSIWALLPLKIATGIIAYIAFSGIFRLAAWRQTLEILRSIVHKK